MDDQHRARILLIDDEPRLLKAMAIALAPEHDVVMLTSAQEAIDRIAAGETFDLVLCDLIMPRVTGMDFYERVGPIAPGLTDRLVFITGGAHTSRANAFIEQVGIQWLHKPLSVVELRAAVRAHLVRLAGAGDHRIDVVENDR